MTAPEWKTTACILRECNCGLEVQLGGADHRHLVKLRGDDCDPWVATPWHKHVPANVERVP